MKQGSFKILSNKALTGDVYRLILLGDCSEITKPGQFVNIALDGFYLRRPISVCDLDGSMLTLIYKVVGHGTTALSTLGKGETLDLLTGLGNGYDIAKSGKNPVLIGGGVGSPPLYLLAKKLIAAGIRPKVILGFNTKSDIFYEEEFSALGLEVTVLTADGSYGTKGFVTDALKHVAHDYSFSCGPEPMLSAVYSLSNLDGQFSFEARMGCGFGACMGCSCETKYGAKRICRDGPVLEREEIIW